MNGGVYRSTSNGNSWTQINNDLNSLDVTVYSLAVTPSGKMFAGAVNSVYYSNTNGTNRTRLDEPTHGSFGPMAVNANGHVFVGTAWGRLKGNDGILNSWSIRINVNAPTDVRFTNTGRFYFIPKLPEPI